MSIDLAADARVNSRTGVSGIGYLSVTVKDVERARDFYRGIVGFSDAGSDVFPGIGPHAVMGTASGQAVVLAVSDAKSDLNDTGVHQAYRVGQGQRDAISTRLQHEGIKVHTYREDRPEEAEDNFYFFDPDGNRIQLVVNSRDSSEAVAGIEHVGFIVPDILWGEYFYGTALGFTEQGRTGWKTADHARAKLWAAGEEEMAPGTRRLDKLYMTMGGQNEVARANAQIYYTIGNEALVMYLATRHIQEPPESQIKGAPAIGLAVTLSGLDQAADALSKNNWVFEGPTRHPASAPYVASLYLKDPGGNFVEFCVPRN